MSNAGGCEAPTSQASTKMSPPIHSPQLPADASEQPRGKTPGQCCAAPQQCSLRWGSLEAEPAPAAFPCFGTQRLARTWRERGLVLAPHTAQVMHNTVIHPWIIESWLQCSAESLGKTTDVTWPIQVRWAAGLFFVLFRSNYDARHKLEMQTREVFCIWRQSYIPFTNKTFF